jgi:pimeloyl-ACP methyl ester carboxylesterase
MEGSELELPPQFRWDVRQMSSGPTVPFGGGEAEPVSIEFISEDACVRGRFFAAAGMTPATTLLLVPGWPGNPNDVLGLGALLVEQGINVCTFNPRGLHQSEGIHSHANTLQDIGAALRWLRQADVRRRFEVDLTRLVLGGHSYGGGMAMAYAARDSSIRRVISIAGTDHGEFIREFQRNAAFAEGVRRMLWSTRALESPARFEVEAGLKELVDHQDIYGLRENAANLADRSILLIGGWEDEQVTIDQFLLPLYRELKGAGAAKVTFLVYHTDHDFSKVLQQLASDIADWLLRD